jgi:hypothetical protein
MGGPPRAARQEPDRKESEMAEKKARGIEVLAEHEDERLLVAEGRVESRAARGDEIVAPTGRAGEEGGTR